MFEQEGCPVDESAKRPLISFVLFAFNQEHYIREALDASLAQTYSPLEIIISDDCSSDDTYRVIEEVTTGYSGPHTLVIRKNEHNIGLAAHINQVMTLVRGELVVVAAGDDISLPERVSVVTQHWLEGGRESGSIFSRFRVIHDNGEITQNDTTFNKKRYTLADRDLTNTQTMTVGTLGCSHAWTRDIFDFFGPLNERIIHEDITIPLRSLLIGSVTFLPDELVLYRLTVGSLSRMAFVDYVDRFRQMARYWEGRMANYEQFARDLEKMILKEHACRDDFEWLSRVVSTQADLAILNYRVFSGSFPEQIRTVFDFSIRASISRRFKLFLISIVPPLYFSKLKA